MPSIHSGSARFLSRLMGGSNRSNTSPGTSGVEQPTVRRSVSFPNMNEIADGAKPKAGPVGPDSTPRQGSTLGHKRSFLDRLRNIGAESAEQREVGARSAVAVTGPHLPEQVAPTYTLEDARLKTQRMCTKRLAELFPEYMGELDEIFPGLDINAARLELMETILSENLFPGLGKPIETGRLEFSNYFGDGILIQDANFKDRTLASFHLNDVIKIQREATGIDNRLQYMVIRKIIAEGAGKFFTRHGFADKDFMNAAQLHEYLSTIGKSLPHIMKDYDVEAVSARVLMRQGVPTVVIRVN